MARLSLFNSPFLLGFEQFERSVDRAAKSSIDGYPPYNIEKISNDQLRISLAVAGFSEHDLSVVVENNQLLISGKQSDDSSKVYLHRGIAARQFQRTFVLADGIEVMSAEISNGLLNIDLLKPKLDVRQRKIKIKTRETSGNYETNKKNINVGFQK